jgi:hypothetical protein
MNRKLFGRTCAVIAAQLGLAASICAAAPAGDFNVFTVGGDASCGFAFIQDAIDAAAAHPGEDYVFIAANRTYADQHLVVADQDVDIIGGFTDCSDFDPGVDQTTIGGTTGHSVFEIEGTSHVFMRDLVLTGAVMDADHSGGGIYFGGQGALTLQTVWVFQNQAGYGGGIDVSPTGPTEVTLTGSVVSSNTALVSGGGIRIEGQTTLNVKHSPPDQFDYITHNTALGQGDIGYGGGIEVLGPAIARFAAVLAQNSAPYGAGVAALATEDGHAYVGVYATNPASPGAIYENVASRTGGGIFLKPSAQGRRQALLCADNFDIHSNTAVNGAAIYADLDDDMGSSVDLGPADPRVVCALDSVECSAGVSCNVSDDNVATVGAIVLVQAKGDFRGNRFSMRRNQAGTLIGELTDDATSVALSNCLMTGNSVLGSLIDAGTPGDLHIESGLAVENCTLAGNVIGAPAVVHAQVSAFSLTKSIIEELGRVTVDGLVFPPDVHYVLSNDASTLPSSADVIQGEATFVDAANGDYHLQPSSIGVDFAPAALTIFDLDGLPRVVDLGGVENVWGATDLGAYEIQEGAVADPIFSSGFD